MRSARSRERSSRWAEAVDEYEAVVELQPAYFPALTRLAYLYYRQGMHVRAVEMWRRALPVVIGLVPGIIIGTAIGSTLTVQLISLGLFPYYFQYDRKKALCHLR